MDRQEFIKLFEKASDNIDIDRINEVIFGCLDRYHDKYPQYERGHMNIMAAMEESAEFIEALSRRERGRTQDNYDILEEAADILIAIWCAGHKYGFSHKDIIKAVNVKIDREFERIRDHKMDMETQ